MKKKYKKSPKQINVFYKKFKFFLKKSKKFLNYPLLISAGSATATIFEHSIFPEFGFQDFTKSFLRKSRSEMGEFVLQLKARSVDDRHLRFER